MAKRVEVNMKAACGYVAAGIGIGAALSVLFAPRSGEETRKWIASKWLDALEAANWKVWRSRDHIGQVMNRGQQEIIKVVEAGREAFEKSKVAESPVAVL
jgi:gas vesicle protein